MPKKTHERCFKTTEPSSCGTGPMSGRPWPRVRCVRKAAAALFHVGGDEEGRVGMAPVVHAPGQRSAATLGGWGFAISKFTRNPEAAWQVVQYLTSRDQLVKIQSRMGRIPARRSLLPPEFAPILESARMRPAIPEYAQASDILQRWLSAALTGRVDPEEALKKAAHETRSLLRTGP